MKKLIHATITPLASIFGSGFLVIVPILAGAVGPYMIFAMVGICALAYAVGAIIRYNIKHAEPVLENNPGRATWMFERASDIALVLAYIISVCLYLHILSAFVLSGVGVDSEVNEDLLTSAIILLITIVGVTRGLADLKALERWAIYVTLLIIFLLFAGFTHYDWAAWHSPAGLQLPALLAHTPWEIVTVLAGTLIVVQGFETPRYLGGMYTAKTRIRASRLSQIVSSVIYVIFIALALPITAALNSTYDDNSLIVLAGLASGLLVVPLIAAAALSQFSAAVADTFAANGNLKEMTRGRVSEKAAYLVVGIAAILLAWFADTFQILAIASRAFALYYMLQCLVAFSIAKSPVRRAGMLVIAGALGFITVFAVPVS